MSYDNRHTFALYLHFPRHHTPLFRHTPPYCLWPKAYCLFLFLSSRNPDFNIFNAVVL